MDFEGIKTYIERYRSEGKKIFATSSFQTHSSPLLHVLSRIDKDISIMFINTGYHFPETVRFRDEVTERLGLNLVDVKSMVPRNLQRDSSGQLYFTSDPDYCCFMNKTQPLEPTLMQYDVWINGIRGDQNANRRSMGVEQKAKHDITRFHPILDWSSKMIYDYIREHNLPKHPLENSGYLSIGCEPCTRKFDINDDRSGRWFGLNKTECGLHTDLVDK
jgi:phosphoadenosine phosphosulfate reductase